MKAEFSSAQAVQQENITEQKKDGKTAVLMKCREGDADYHRHIKYTKFFLNHNIPVPHLKQHLKKMSAIFEDLGDISLFIAGLSAGAILRMLKRCTEKFST